MPGIREIEHITAIALGKERDKVDEARRIDVGQIGAKNASGIDDEIGVVGAIVERELQHLIASLILIRAITSIIASGHIHLIGADIQVRHLHLPIRDTISLARYAHWIVLAIQGNVGLDRANIIRGCRESDDIRTLVRQRA
jgi:hypothetical protein